MWHGKGNIAWFCRKAMSQSYLTKFGPDLGLSTLIIDDYGYEYIANTSLNVHYHAYKYEYI